MLQQRELQDINSCDKYLKGIIMAAIVALSPVWIQAQYLDNAGLPLSGGRLLTYNANGDVEQITYTDSSGTVQNTNPIILDSSGRLQTGLWLVAGHVYSFVLQDQHNNELARVGQVSTVLLNAGSNITLDPPSGVGASVMISAAGSSGKANDHGQSYIFTGSNSGSYPDFTNTSYTSATFTSPTVPIGLVADVEVFAASQFKFNVAGAFVVEITTELQTLSPEGYLAWPTGESVFGVSFDHSLFSTSYHSKYSNINYDGLSNTLQRVSFTDSFVVSVDAGMTSQFTIWAANNTNPSQQLNCNVQIVITRIGPKL